LIVIGLLLSAPFFVGAQESDPQKPAPETEAQAEAKPAPTEEKAKGPSAQLVETLFEFEPVAEGVEVTHDYLVRNTGTEPLDIEKVKTG
jgi:hypothetical protein